MMVVSTWCQSWAAQASTAGAGAMLRVGMTNPPFIAEHLPAVAAALKAANVFEYIHIPVQSGSDRRAFVLYKAYFHPCARARA